MFFVVLLSATLQGWTLPAFASKLGLEEERPARPMVSLELLALRDVRADIIDCLITSDSPLSGRFVRDMRLPDGAVIAMVSRGSTMIMPRGSTELRPDDHLFVIARDDVRAAVERVLAGSDREADSPPPTEPGPHAPRPR